MWEELFVYVKPFLNAILIGMGGLLLAFILSQIVRRALARPIGEGWSRFAASLVALLVVIWTIKLILDSAGAAGLVVILVTTLTGAFAIGSERFAADLVSGIGLLFSREYAVGDFVSLAGYEGKIVNISLTTTTLENDYGDLVYVRNAEATGGTVVKYPSKPVHLVAIKVPFPVDQDLNIAVSAIEEAVKDFSPELINQPYQPTVIVESGEAGYFIVEIRAYTAKKGDFETEKTRLYLLATNAIKRAGQKLAR